LTATYLYALYERKKVYVYESANSTEQVLKQLPDFQVYELGTQNQINSKDMIANNVGLFVHIWGTWCAPCEKEMPVLISWAKSLDGTGVKFVLIAVNDEEVKVQKFMKRFAPMPANVILTIDRDNKVMDRFGTLKVPETFLFNKEGKHINKFVGPQEWLQESFATRLPVWLGIPSL